MQLVAPSAVSTAEIIEASICSDHFVDLLTLFVRPLRPETRETRETLGTKKAPLRWSFFLTREDQTSYN
jgi:hypothetical protein